MGDVKISDETLREWVKREAGTIDLSDVEANELFAEVLDLRARVKKAATLGNSDYKCSSSDIVEEAEARVMAAEAKVAAIELEIKSWEEARFEKPDNESEWTRHMMRCFREALKGRVPT